MTNSLLNRFLKIAVALSVFGALAFSNLYAASDTNLLVNGDFESNWNVPAGWTVSGNPVMPKGGENGNGQGGYAPSIFNEPYYMVSLLCGGNCPTTGFGALSQTVNGLQSGHQYKLTYYSMGYPWIDGRHPSSEAGLIVASLGSQKAPRAATPFWAGRNVDAAASPLAWAQQTFTFDYKDTSSSALFSFTGFFTGLAVGCLPCIEFKYFAKASLVDVTPPAPMLTVQKALGTGGRINDVDQFKVSIVNATTSAPLNSATTGGTGSAITAGLASITGDTATTYKLAEEMLPGSNSKIEQYDASLLCTNATAGGTQSPNSPIPLSQNLPLLKFGDDVTCTLTNTPKAPTLRLTKALGSGGRIDNADQFTVSILNRLIEFGSSTTSGTGNIISGGSTNWVNLLAGSSCNLTEVMTGTSASKMGQYDGVVSCTNAWTGSPTAVPSALGIACTPTYGDVLDCRITNTAKPVKLTLTQLVISPFPVNLLPPFKFNYSINNGWPVQPQGLTTNTLNVPVSTAQQIVAARNVDTRLSTSLPDARWFVSSFECTDTSAALSGNPSGNVARIVASSITVPAAHVRAGATRKCTLTKGHKVP